jgi:putative transposase
MPRIGTRKLHFLLSETMQKHGISIGRDKLFDLLQDHGLLVRRRKRKRMATTDSNHPYKKYPNRIRGLQVMRPNQLWVSDITYISLKDKFCYLSLVTDAYSRKIIGYCLYPTLQKEGPLAALDMAFDSCSSILSDRLIHHSDRGRQYCCSDYIARLQSKEVAISMTEKGDPYENAIAERINGTLKIEFALENEFEHFEQAALAVKNAINIYNQKRPHDSCDHMTPDQTHQQQGLLKTKWKRRLAMV